MLVSIWLIYISHHPKPSKQTDRTDSWSLLIFNNPFSQRTMLYVIVVQHNSYTVLGRFRNAAVVFKCLHTGTFTLLFFRSFRFETTFIKIKFIVLINLFLAPLQHTYKLTLALTAAWLGRCSKYPPTMAIYICMKNACSLSILSISPLLDFSKCIFANDFYANLFAQEKRMAFTQRNEKVCCTLSKSSACNISQLFITGSSYHMIIFLHVSLFASHLKCAFSCWMPFICASDLWYTHIYLKRTLAVIFKQGNQITIHVTLAYIEYNFFFYSWLAWILKHWNSNRAFCEICTRCH